MSALVSYALQGVHDKDPAEEIWDELKAFLPLVRRIGGADVMVAVYKRPARVTAPGGTEFYLPDKTRDEDDVQGVAGLVVMMGPLAYKYEKTERWFVDENGEPAPPKIGDWVSFDVKVTHPFLLGKRMCRLVHDQYIRSIIERPDIVA
jgi:hypothetical protein